MGRKPRGSCMYRWRQMGNYLGAPTFKREEDEWSYVFNSVLDKIKPEDITLDAPWWVKYTYQHQPRQLEQHLANGLLREWEPQHGSQS